MVVLRLDPQASPNILTFLLASREMSSTLNPTTLCGEADVPCFTIPSDPVPEMDKLKISLTAKLHSTFPPLRREAWEWLQGCKQLNLEAPRGNRKQPGQSAHQHPLLHKLDIPISGSYLHVSPPASISSSFPPSLRWRSGSQAVNSWVIYQRGFCLRS